MPAGDQGVTMDRYRLVPRTAIFVRDGDSFLLLRGSADKKLWPGKYNGVGGHIERGEDVLRAAHREFHEETGLKANLWLCGTVLVDAGETGVGLYVFTGEVIGGTRRDSAEGTLEWIALDAIPALPTVEDVPQLTARIHAMQPGDAPFAARSYYDASGRLRFEFSN
jgi:8-oxo-dGTP diphosphatase